mmetsp:Transcript_4003/g.7693  ORF Transcript_4003/g.7693 Transcript_4003/m.7693 type:complete len:318 (+) Transcript_4003:1147-2100(+)
MSSAQYRQLVVIDLPCETYVTVDREMILSNVRRHAGPPSLLLIQPYKFIRHCTRRQNTQICQQQRNILCRSIITKNIFHLDFFGQCHQTRHILLLLLFLGCYHPLLPKRPTRGNPTGSIHKIQMLRQPLPQNWQIRLIQRIQPRKLETLRRHIKRLPQLLGRNRHGIRPYLINNPPILHHTLRTHNHQIHSFHHIRHGRIQHHRRRYPRPGQILRRLRPTRIRPPLQNNHFKMRILRRLDQKRRYHTRPSMSQHPRSRLYKGLTSRRNPITCREGNVRKSLPAGNNLCHAFCKIWKFEKTSSNVFEKEFTSTGKGNV